MTRLIKPVFSVGIDLDLTYVDTGLGWYLWLCKHFPQIEEIPDHDIDYNLGRYFGESRSGLKHMDYWSNNHLYDDLEPRPGAHDCIRDWKERGIRELFISHTKSGHFKSKFRMLKKEPFLNFGTGNGDAFIATKEKGLLSGALNVMIDDRIDMLNQFDDHVVKILFKTPYTQKETPRVPFDLVSDSWVEINEFVNEVI